MITEIDSYTICNISLTSKKRRLSVGEKLNMCFELQGVALRNIPVSY